MNLQSYVDLSNSPRCQSERPERSRRSRMTTHMSYSAFSKLVMTSVTPLAVSVRKEKRSMHRKSSRKKVNSCISSSEPLRMPNKMWMRAQIISTRLPPLRTSRNKESRFLTHQTQGSLPTPCHICHRLFTSLHLSTLSSRTLPCISIITSQPTSVSYATCKWCLSTTVPSVHTGKAWMETHSFHQ